MLTLTGQAALQGRRSGLLVAQPWSLVGKTREDVCTARKHHSGSQCWLQVSFLFCFFWFETKKPKW